MPDMTLAEALRSDEVRAFLGDLIQESVTEALPDAVKAAVEEQMPTLRESVRDEVRQEIAADGHFDSLHTEAKAIIEAAKGLTPSARENLLSDYSLDEKDGKPKPGRALALIEAVKDDDGKITKTARLVLRESVEEDIKRVRNVLRESAPSLPYAPGGGSDGGGEAKPVNLDGDPDVARLREKGLDFGLPKAPEPAKA